MDETWQWDDVRLFLAVGRAGGLAGAARLSGISPPTLGRRMAALETCLGRQLFVRQRDGYVLTAKGNEFLRLAEALELNALAIDRWRTSDAIGSVVKIAAGTWTSAFIARHMGDLVGEDEDIQIELVSGAGIADLLRREANLGLRNHRPEIPGLAGRKLTRVEFAIFGGLAYVEGRVEARDHRRFKACRWIAFSPPGPKTPSGAWIDEHLEHAPNLRCRSGQEVLEAALAGRGLCVLPCFIGDVQSGLVRASDIIQELGHDQWLVSHDQDRTQRHIRRVSDRLRSLAKEHRRLFLGQQARPL
ncbi:LysR family transcriptional regulator [Taklimakanibacter lacteus]|uniref:LysR family transcriptional regulator n=1 Tax=Taklimakanibacter lacteus TaxID=2268456 RepID=UPI000E66F704